MTRLLSLPNWLLGGVPFLVLLIFWWALPRLVEFPAYMLPSVEVVANGYYRRLLDGSLIGHIGISLSVLAMGFLIGNALAVPIGIAVALNANVRDTLMPTLTFLQSIAGIAWVPLAIIWFGIGYGAVLFVIANAIFFGTLYNTIVGVRAVPEVLIRSARSLGANRWQTLASVILPGAFVQILLGFRTSMAFGWRALVAGEMIAGASGLGYITIEAVQWYSIDVVIMGMITIGLLWLLMERFLFRPIENATVRRWGIVRDR